MSDPIESNTGVTPDDNSTARTDELPSNETKLSDDPSTANTAFSFNKLRVHSDSESSGDEVTAFDRIRVSSDSDEPDDKKTVEVISASEELPPPVPVALSSPVTETEEVKVEEILPEDKLEEIPNESKVANEIIKSESPNNACDTSPIQDNNDTPDKEVVEDKQTSKDKDNSDIIQSAKDKPKSPKENINQNTDDWNESEKGNKYSQNKEFSREKGKSWKSYQEDSFRDGNRRDRGKGRSNREDRGGRRDNFTSYGHDDRFYVSQDTRTNEPEFESNVIQGRSPPTRSWKGARGRGGEGKWKHDKFYEDEQGPIAVESTNNSYSSYSSPQSVSQSQYPDKKGRGRGRKQYSDQSPIPGFPRNSPRQERRGRGKSYREESDVYSSSSTRPNRGRGISRYSNYKDDNSGVYLSKPIVFVSQNKIESPTDRHKDKDNTRTTLSASDAVEYIQPSASTPFPSVPIPAFSTKPEIGSDLQHSKRVAQMKYGPYNNKKDTEKYNTASNSSYTGLGRGKGKYLHPVALLQRGQQYKRPTEPVNYEYEKEYMQKKEPKEPISLAPDSNPSFPYNESKPPHKPERYSTQRLKQAQLADHNNATAINVGTPVLNANSPNPALNSSKLPSTQEHGYNAHMRVGEHPHHETRSSMMNVQYSEFYPTPFKEEMVGNQMSPMHHFNLMPDYMMSPDVMKEGDFQQMQFPPFIPQEMMNMKGAPNMMGGIPYMGNPQLGPEYMMGSEVPPNLQSDLYVPMQSYYPPI